jgi:hypothetical protein
MNSKKAGQSMDALKRDQDIPRSELVNPPSQIRGGARHRRRRVRHHPQGLLRPTFVIPNPVQPSDDGLSLVSYTGPALTVLGELNKVASNISNARGQAGVHWRGARGWAPTCGPCA